MTCSRACGLVVVVAVLAIGAPRVRAQNEKTATVTYRVKQGDTLGMVASEYYGDRTKAAFIRTENKLPSNKKLHQGDRLRVPILREITTSPGDTLASLAETMLGDERRAPFIADLNNLPLDTSLAAGMPLLIPFAVTYVADGKETLASISGAYYGSEKHADVLKVYNFLETTTLEKGDQIKIPSFNVRVHASRLGAPDPAAKERRQKRAEQVAKAASAIPGARHAWRIGNYQAVRDALGELDPAYLDRDAAVDVGVLLGCAHVAFDETDAAVASFKRVLARAPSHVLRRFDHSPKILGAWKKAGGQIE